MTLFCPLCNWELDRDQHCTNRRQCNYQGAGQSRADIEREAKGCQLGDITGPGSRNLGAGCYDSDSDMS